MQVPVGGHRRELDRGVVPLQSGAGEGCRAGTAFLDDGHQRCHVVHLQLRLRRDIDGAFGHQHVRPEVAVSALTPRSVQKSVESPWIPTDAIGEAE